MPARSPRSFISDRLIEETYQRTRRHLIGGIIALAGVVLSGILWYKLVEGWTWLDAIYMSVITLATVGFSEVNPLGARGRLFTIILILMGVVVIAYILNCFTEAVIQGHLQAGFRLRQRRKLMAALSDHYIICGFGRTGRQVSSEFSVERIPFIVVDSDENSIQQAQQMGFTTFQGDATQDQVLLQVGIEKSQMPDCRSPLRCRKSLHRPFGKNPRAIYPHHCPSQHRRSRPKNSSVAVPTSSFLLILPAANAWLLPPSALRLWTF